MRNTITIQSKPPLLLAGFALLLALISQSACIHHRELVNFDQGLPFDSLVTNIDNRALRIQHDDLLAISVQVPSSDPNATAAISTKAQALSSSGIGGTVTDAPLYLVDINGEINMPMVGKIPVIGLTTQQTRDTVTNHMKRFFKDPIVNVRLSNFRFSVMGEVNRAGTYSVGYEKVNLLEALSQAGDLTQYGNREKILIIRQTDGQRRYGWINLHNRDIFQSPYFYIEQGDVIYVEPLSAKVGSTADASTKYLSWALPIVSVVGLLVTFFTAGNP